MAGIEPLLDRLIAARVEFVLVGGMAAIAHGAATVTLDTDVCLPLGPENLRRLFAALADLHPVHRMTPARPPFDEAQCGQPGWQNLYLQTDWGQLDCLGSVAGVGGFDVVRRESVEITLPAGPLRVLSLDALIRSKEALGRGKDVRTLRELRAIRDRRP